MKRIALLLCAVLAVSAAFYGCGKTEPAPASSEPAVVSMPETEEEIIEHNMNIDETAIELIQDKTPAAGSKTATIKTSAGDIKIVLFPEEAPKAVENFTKLVEDGFYNGLHFYRIVPSVEIAAGDPKNTGDSGKSAQEDGAQFEDEYSLNLWHFNGAVAMDNGGLPGANDSRFYIVQSTKEQLSKELVDDMMDAGFPEKVINKYLELGGVPNNDAKDTVFAQVIEGMDVVEKIATSPRTPDYKPQEDIVIESITLGTV